MTAAMVVLIGAAVIVLALVVATVLTELLAAVPADPSESVARALAALVAPTVSTPDRHREPRASAPIVT